MSGPLQRRGLPLRSVFAVPAVVAVLSLVGLVSALTGDGLRDAVSWAGLAVPIAVAAWAVRRRRR